MVILRDLRVLLGEAVVDVLYFLGFKRTFLLPWGFRSSILRDWPPPPLIGFLLSK
jgi:hypothetical protein